MPTETAADPIHAARRSTPVLLLLLCLLLGGTGCGGAEDPSPGEVVLPDKLPSLYGKSRGELLELPLDHLRGELTHLDSTAAPHRAEIDKLCTTLVDFFSGRETILAQNRLQEIGKPAIPLVIAAFRQCGDLDSKVGMVNACVVDETLRMIAGGDVRTTPLRPMAMPGKKQIERTARSWAIWWFAEGYGQSSFATEEDD